MSSISVILPSIRPFLLENCIASVADGAGDMPWEVIVVGPKPLPAALEDVHNIKYVKDFGSPSRAANIGLQLVENEFATILSDDCTVNPGIYKKIVADQYGLTRDRMSVVGMKYNEGGSINQPGYWLAKSHPQFKDLNGIPDSMPVAPMFVVESQLLKYYIGGWDCSFECINWGGHDLIARAYHMGINVKVWPDSFAEVAWGPGIDGLYNDHRPLWESDQQNTELFRKRWMTRPNQIVPTPFQLAERVWKRRFKTQ